MQMRLKSLHPSASHHHILHLHDRRARCVRRRILSSSRAPRCCVGARCPPRAVRQSPRSVASEISSTIDFPPLRGPRARSARCDSISLIERAIDSVRYNKLGKSRGGGCCLGWVPSGCHRAHRRRSTPGPRVANLGVILRVVDKIQIAK